MSLLRALHSPPVSWMCAESQLVVYERLLHQMSSPIDINRVQSAMQATFVELNEERIFRHRVRERISFAVTRPYIKLMLVLRGSYRGVGEGI